MGGSMRERKPRVWELRVYTGRDPLTKRPRQVSRTFRGGKREASRALAELTAETTEGKHGGSNATVSQLLDAWLKAAKGSVSGSTYATYESTANRIKKTDLALVRLSRLEPQDIDNAYSQLQQDGVTAHVMVQIHRYLGTALRQARRWGWIRSNPQEDAKAPRKPDMEPRVISATDIRALVVEAKKTDPDLAGAILLAATTGLRRGELAALKWTDIQGPVLTVGRSHAIVKGAVVEGAAKMRRQGETETIVLDPVCMDALEDIRASQEAKAEGLGAELPSDGFVLSADGMGNTPRRPDRLGREIREAGERIGVKASPHRLRHWMASNLVASGMDISAVATRMRHRDQALTLRTYVHDDGKRAIEAAAILGRALVPTEKEAP